MIFKKHISILLTIFLLVSNLGLAFNVHYCDEKIASITLNTISSSHELGGDCCGVVEEDSQCCHDKLIKAEVKSDQIIVKTLLFDFMPVVRGWRLIIFASDYNFEQKYPVIYSCDANAPPLYLLYSQYTFYA